MSKTYALKIISTSRSAAEVAAAATGYAMRTHGVNVTDNREAITAWVIRAAMEQKFDLAEVLANAADALLTIEEKEAAFHE